MAATVAIVGDGRLADSLRAAGAAQDDLALVTGAAEAELEAAVDTVRGTATTALGSRSVGPLAPERCALARAARAIPGVRRIDATVLRPPAGPEARSGPVNAVRIDAPDAIVLGAGGPVATVQPLVAPHTLCWVVAATLELEAGIEPDDAIDLLASGRRTVVAPAALGVNDTAALVDMMRDLHRGSHWFFETIVFERSVVCSGDRLSLVLAADVGAVAADAIDELRLALSLATRREDSEARTDRALSVLEAFADRDSPAPAQEIAGG